MLTQISIKGDGCQSEYTKIASQSFLFVPKGGVPGVPAKFGLFTGGGADTGTLETLPIWSTELRNYSMRFTGGSITDVIRPFNSATGISLPINLVPDDVVTLSGNAYFTRAAEYLEAGWQVRLVVGVYYFSCKDVNKDGTRVFTFIPASFEEFDFDGKACFNANVRLTSNFDFHDTRILVGYNILIICPDECLTPIADGNQATVSYTLDVQRPCKADVTNYIIKNCCEGSITELVNIPGLVVGNFHVDNEGNCWEVIEESKDVTNFTRTFTNDYATCLECQDDNGCPLNLAISSCCVEGIELVTGSLPGLVVGDTFLDNYGLCWYVMGETPEPLSEESITVVSIIEGDCETCTTENPCPNFYGVQSCCTDIKGVIAVPDILNVDDSFVDAQGQCWQVREIASQLPTIYGVEVVTVYTGAVEPDTNCDLCIAANPCPTEYFITIKSCCDQDRVEVAQVPADFMFFEEGLIFSDYWGICWEVLSFDTTGVATFEIWPWNDEEPSFSSYRECKQCLGDMGCNGAYNIKDCQTDIVYNNVPLNTDGPPSIGSCYIGYISGPLEEINSCFEILSFGYPTYPNSTKGSMKDGPFATCPECQLARNTTKTLEFSQCCGGPNIIVQYTGPWYNGIGFAALLPLSDSPEGVFVAKCVTLVGFSTATPTLYNINGATIYTGDCSTCFSTYNIECP